MRPYEYYFEDEFAVDVNHKTYQVYVSGMKVRSDVYGAGYDTEIKTIKVYDFLGDLIDDTHEDYDAVIEDVYDNDFENVYECEGLYDDDY